tara:strand:+ start:364 stop:3138 length:2775 start_codon:yes stop_codon:yes gene_type:complete
MASLAGVTDQLQRQNQQELASVIRIANEQLVSSGARQGLDEIAKIFEAQQGTSLSEFKATKKQIEEMQRGLASLEGVNSEEKRMLQRVLETSQASIGENVTFKKSIGELTANTVETSIDSIGGMIGGALSGSPILSFGASFVGDRFQQFKENRKAAKEAQKERADKIAQEAEQQEREFSLLRSQMDNASVAAASGKTQEEIDSLSLDQLNEEKDVIIQRAFAAKQEADLQEEDRKNIESLQSKFGLDQSTDSPSSSNNENNNDRDNIRSVGETGTDVGASTQRHEIINLLADIDSRLHGSPDYLKTLNEKIDILIKDDPSSLDIENQRELKRHQKKMERLSQNQIKATSNIETGNSDSGGMSGLLDTALQAYLGKKGLDTALDMFGGGKDSDPKNQKSSKNTAEKPKGKLARIAQFGKNAISSGLGMIGLGSGGVEKTNVSTPKTNPKPGMFSRFKDAVSEKMPFRSTTVPAGATVGRGPDGRFTSLIPDNVPEVTKPAGAGKSMMGGLKTAGNFVGRTAVPLTVALGAMQAGSILMDDEMDGDQKVNAGAKLAGGTGGAMAGAAAGAAIMAPFAPFTLGLSSVAGGLIGGALGYMGGEKLGGMGAEAAGFSAEAKTEQEVISEKKLKNDERLVEIQDEMMEAGDRMARSKSGENVYFGREHKGIEEDEQKIKELQEEFDRLNMTVIKPKVESASEMPEEGNVEPRPDKNFFGGDAAQRKWDKMYGETHNDDGTLKKVPENLGKVEMSAEELNKSSALGIGFNGKTSSMAEKTEGITEKYLGKEMTHQELEDGIKSGSVKRSIGRKLQKKIVMKAKKDHPERFVLSPEEETVRQEVMQSMPSQNVSASDTAVNNKVAAGETLKSSALNQGNKNSNNNVVGNNNTSNTSVTNNTQNVKRVDNGGVRNPDPTAARARMGLGMGMAY